MGRQRVEIKKIENKGVRQVTFAKRRNGLLKKAYEISALCDIEVALLAFSPSGKPTIFGGKKRFEQILSRYINLPEHQQGGLEDHEPLRRLIEGMRLDRNLYNNRKIGNELYMDAQMEEIQREMNSVGNQLEEVTTQLKYYEDIPSYIKTVNEMEAYEEFLKQTMTQIQIHKKAVLEEGNQLEENYLAAPLLEKLGVEASNADQMLIGGGHASSSRVGAFAGGGISIYNVNPAITVPQTSMLNFVDSNGPPPIGNQQQYGNNILQQSPLFLVQDRKLALANESDEVRGYYLDLARQMGFPLPGLTIGNPPKGAEHNPTGHGGPDGGEGPSGRASFQAARDPRG